MKVQYKVYHEYVVLKFWGKLEGEGKIARILRIFFFLFPYDLSMEWSLLHLHRHRTSGSLHILFPFQNSLL